MEPFSSIMSLTYTCRRQALSPLQTSCSSKHKLNGVFFKHYIPDIRSQATSCSSKHKLNGVFFEHYVPDIHSHATSLISIADKLLLKAQTNGIFFEHYVPVILSQATSLTSIAGKLLLEAQTRWSLFRALCPRHTLAGDKPHLHCRQAAPRSTNSMESFSGIMSPTYARMRQASPPLQTSCSSNHKLNRVFFEHYVPDMRSQATSLTSFADKLLLEAQTQWSRFRALCPRHALVCDKPHLRCKQAAPRSTNSMESFSSIMSPTCARKRQASPPLKASYFSVTKFMESFQASCPRYTHTSDKPYLHCRQATSRVETQWSLFQVLCLRTYTDEI
ncbi:unnamed protein product [Prunus armeniaca]